MNVLLTFYFYFQNTSADNRKQGIYTTILKYRLEESIRFGKSYVVVEAMKETSAPILQKYGFEIIGSVTEYYQTNT